MLANGALQLTLGPADASDTERLVAACLMTLAFRNLDRQTIADGLALGAIYALMAVGIGLVFGVLRLVNFAYGQLVMAGAFALALASGWGWPLWAAILLCFAVVLGLSVAMDRLVFRPLRSHSPP